MQEPEIVSSARSFKKTVAELKASGITTAYVRVIPNQTKLAVWTESHDENFGWFAPLDLSTLKNAEKVWRELWEGEVTRFRLYDTASGDRIACIAKDAIWNALPQLCMLYNKTMFVEHSEDAFERLVGAETDKAMSLEAFLLGISVRRLWKKRSEG